MTLTDPVYGTQPTAGDGRLSSEEVCRYGGMSYRVLDYMCRTHPGMPACQAYGSGSRRRWTPAEAQQAVVLCTARMLGCDHGQMTAVLTELRANPAASSIVVGSAEGAVALFGADLTLPADFTGWVISVPAPPAAALDAC